MPLLPKINPRAIESRSARLRMSSDDVERSGMFPPGGFAIGTSMVGGPLTLDAFGTKRAPTPWELVESYKSLIFACVQINANAVSRSPLRLYANTSKGKRASDASGPRSIDRSMHRHLRTLPYCRSLGPSRDDVEEITNHPLIDTLDAPAIVEDENGEVSYFSREDFIALISVYCDVVGSHYVCPMGPNGRPPKYLWPLFSQYVIPQPAPGNPTVGRYTYFAETFVPSQLIRFRSTSLSIRDPYKAGYSPVYAALQYARLEDTFVAIQEQLLAAGPRPNLIVSAKDPMMPPSDDERRRYEIDLNRRHGKGNAGNALVTTGAWDVTPVSYSPQDLAGMEISKYDLQRIANCLGTPVPYLEGDTDAMNLKGADVQHARNAIEPRHRMIAGTLTHLARQYDPRLFFAFDPALPEDEELKAKVIDMKLKNQSMTINQANEDSPRPPVPWGDEPWQASSLVQPSMAQAKQQMDLTSEAHTIENNDRANEFQFGQEAQQGEDQQDDEEMRSLDVEINQIRGKIDEELMVLRGNPYQDVNAVYSGNLRARNLDNRLRDLERMIKGNPYHDDEGHFTGTGGHTGRKPKEPNKVRKKGEEPPDANKTNGAAKLTPKKSGSHESEGGKPGEKNSGNSGKNTGQTKPDGGMTADSGGKESQSAQASESKPKTKAEMTDRERKGKPKDYASKTAEIAAASAKRTGAEEQRYGEAQEKEVLMKALDGKWKGGSGKLSPLLVQGTDSSAQDVVVTVGKIQHGLECKTIISQGTNRAGTKAQLSIKKSAMQRKLDWHKEPPTDGATERRIHCVGIDHRDKAVDSTGKFIGNKEAHSGHELYYQRGVGQFRINTMYKVKSSDEIKHLMSLADKDLPDVKEWNSTR